MHLIRHAAGPRNIRAAGAGLRQILGAHPRSPGLLRAVAREDRRPRGASRPGPRVQCGLTRMALARFVEKTRGLALAQQPRPRSAPGAEAEE